MILNKDEKVTLNRMFNAELPGYEEKKQIKAIWHIYNCKISLENELNSLREAQKRLKETSDDKLYEAPTEEGIDFNSAFLNAFLKQSREKKEEQKKSYSAPRLTIRQRINTVLGARDEPYEQKTIEKKVEKKPFIDYLRARMATTSPVQGVAPVSAVNVNIYGGRNFLSI